MCFDRFRRRSSGATAPRSGEVAADGLPVRAVPARTEVSAQPQTKALDPQAMEALPPLPVDTPDGPVADRLGALEMNRSVPVAAIPVRLALRDQVLGFSIPQWVDLTAFPARCAGQWFAGSPDSPHQRATALVPVLRPWPRFVGAGELIVKAKAFDDGLLAAVELASQEPLGPFAGKRPVLRGLREKLSRGGPVASMIDAALEIAGFESAASPDNRQVLDDFLANELRSKPIGFYTWSEELSRIFRQDRLLQEDLADDGDAPAVAALLARDPDLFEGYSRCLRLAERCTNRLAFDDFRRWAEAIASSADPPSSRRAGGGTGPLALFPASRSHETDLAGRLYGSRPIPEDADLLRDLIRAVRSNEIDLRPGQDSGWYDWQTWALETLVASDGAEEASRVVLYESYRDYLETLFRAALALGRETHVKQLHGPRITGLYLPPVTIRPELRLEPLVSHYARRAEGYRYIRGVLRASFGEGALESVHRVRPDGLVEAPLSVELDSMIALFDGAANVSRLELGAAAQGETAGFTRWMETRGDDPDLAADLRMMAPVYHDVLRNLTKVWMFLGWQEDSIAVEFERPPAVLLPGGGTRGVVFERACFPIARPVVIETLVPRVLDRDEFRALCDRHPSPEAILRAVQ
jgi:hypothetical protein